jgi:small-conductance mechanosensitive channel/CRP-like cAMP-binding protein
MADLMAATWAAVQDPLVVALCLLALGGVAARFLFRGYPLGHAITRLVFFVLLTIALLHGQIVPYEPMRPTGGHLHNAVGVALEVAWWLWAAWLMVGILRSVLVFERRPREGKLLQDILAGLIYLAAIFAIIAYVFNLPVQGLLATSGAIAIILGLALQSSLSDVFSGLVLSFSRPYRLDDWIRLDGGTEGQVVELNWRATHILTSQRDLAIVPNSTIAKSKIVNVSSPSRTHGVSVTVQLDARTPPSTGVAMLRQAVLNARSILAFPEPSIVVKSMNAAAVAYEVTFFVENLNAASATQNELFDLIHRHLASADVALAAPEGQPFFAPHEAARKPKSEAERLIAQVPIFASLTPEDRTALAAKLKRKRYGRGDTLLQPGTVLQSLFLVGAGVLSVARQEGGGESEVLRLGPGDHFGAIGLLTGHASVARITALTPAVVYELAKTDLAPILEARPQVAQELSHALAQRQAAGHSVADELGKTPLPHNLSHWFSERIRKLFDLANS